MKRKLKNIKIFVSFQFLFLLVSNIFKYIFIKLEYISVGFYTVHQIIVHSCVLKVPYIERVFRSLYIICSKQILFHFINCFYTGVDWAEKLFPTLIERKNGNLCFCFDPLTWQRTNLFGIYYQIPPC